MIVYGLKECRLYKKRITRSLIIVLEGNRGLVSRGKRMECIVGTIDDRSRRRGRWRREIFDSRRHLDLIQSRDFEGAESSPYLLWKREEKRPGTHLCLCKDGGSRMTSTRETVVTVVTVTTLRGVLYFSSRSDCNGYLAYDDDDSSVRSKEFGH